MKQIRTRLTYANVMSSLAVFLVLGGATAFAATELAKNSVGAKQIKKNAVTSAKIKKEAVAAGKIKNGAVGAAKLGAGAVGADKLADNAVTNAKLAADSVSTGKIAPGAVGSDRIADSAVTGAKLTPSERSEAFHSSANGTSAALPTGILVDLDEGLAVATDTVPAAQYVVIAKSAFFNSALAARNVVCVLYDDGQEIDRASSQLGEAVLVVQGEIVLTGVSDGGNLAMRCRANGSDVSAGHRKMTSIRVGAVS